MEPMAAKQGQDIPLPSLVSSLTRLMTQYAVHPTPGNAGAVVRLLSTLVGHPEVCRNAMLHNTYGRMLPHWRGLMACPREAWARVQGAGSRGGRVH